MSPLKLPRTLRLDPSDSFVFARAAEPGEWAVTGSFLFWDRDPASLTGKDRVAFRSGFLGVRSFGFSTLVVVSEASESDVGRRSGFSVQVTAVLAPPTVAVVGA